MTDDQITVYTDGACSGNPGPGGWGWVVPDGPYGSGAEADSTNQRMELKAVLDALQMLDGPLLVVSDSTYVVNCFRDRWWEGWLKRGWKNSQKKPVANRDLWEPLIDLYRERGDVDFKWVKGHSGDEWNDVADRLAVEACTSGEARSGSGRPEALGPADGERGPGPSASGASAASSKTAESASKKSAGGPPPPAGHLVVLAGHRPPELGGYDANPVSKRVKRQLVEILQAKLKMNGDLVVLTGLQLGAEQLAAEAAMEAGVPYVAVLAYPDPAAVWPKKSQAHFDTLLDGAVDVIVLAQKVPDTKAKIGAAMRKRDTWYAANANEAIVVWDGKDRLVGSVVKALEAALDADVWLLDPAAT